MSRVAPATPSYTRLRAGTTPFCLQPSRRTLDEVELMSMRDALGEALGYQIQIGSKCL